MKKILVSVIYPVFNDKPTDIDQSMYSILNQDYQNLEIIIIDDSNNPLSITAVDKYRNEPRVKIIRVINTGGLPQALNNGLKEATGQLIARADADDIQYSNRISCQVDFMEKHPEIGILGCNVNYIDSEGKFIKTRVFPENSEAISRNLHIRNPLCHSVVMIRKNVLDEIGVYDTNFRRAEDYELWFRATAHKVRIFNLQKVLLDYKMANSTKRDDLNWKMNLILKRKYFSSKHILESVVGILSVYFYLYAPKSVQNFIYNKLA